MRLSDSFFASYFDVSGTQNGRLLAFRVHQRRGTLRVRTLKETLKLITPHMRALGVTRIADLTPLDRIGLSTVSLTIPNLAVENFCCGKGISFESAVVSGLMEAYEYLAAYTPSRPSILNRTLKEVKSFGHALDPNEVGHPVVDKFKADAKYDWIECIELFEQKKYFLSSDLVTQRLRSAPGVTRVNRFQSTGGMATGNSAFEAMAHGLFELIEHDAVVLSNFAPRRKLVFNPKELSKDVQEVWNKIIAAGAEVFCFDITTDIDVPCFEVYIAQEFGLEAYYLHTGFGCHLDPEIALLRALTEACQVRLTYFSGSREDVAIGVSDADTFNNLSSVFESAQTVSFQPSKIKLMDFKVLIRALGARLKKVGLDKIFVCDNSVPGFPFTAVACFVPGLEKLTADEENFYLGPRGQQTLARYGRKNNNFY